MKFVENWKLESWCSLCTETYQYRQSRYNPGRILACWKTSHQRSLSIAADFKLWIPAFLIYRPTSCCHPKFGIPVFLLPSRLYKERRLTGSLGSILPTWLSHLRHLVFIFWIIAMSFNKVWSSSLFLEMLSIEIVGAQFYNFVRSEEPLSTGWLTVICLRPSQWSNLWFGAFLGQYLWSVFYKSHGTYSVLSCWKFVCML